MLRRLMAMMNLIEAAVELGFWLIAAESETRSIVFSLVWAHIRLVIMWLMSMWTLHAVKRASSLHFFD